MAEGFAAVLVLEGEEFHRAVAGKRGAQVADRTIDPHRAGRAEQAH